MTDIDNEPEWAHRAKGVTYQRVATYISAGMRAYPFPGDVDLDYVDLPYGPYDPEDQDPPAEYFITTNALDHGPGGVVIGIKRRRYRLVLEEVDP